MNMWYEQFYKTTQKNLNVWFIHLLENNKFIYLLKGWIKYFYKKFIKRKIKKNDYYFIF